MTVPGLEPGLWPPVSWASTLPTAFNLSPSIHSLFFFIFPFLFFETGFCSLNQAKN